MAPQKSSARSLVIILSSTCSQHIFSASIFGAFERRTRSCFPQERRLEPQAPIAAITLGHVFHDKLQLFHPRHVNIVMGLGSAANYRRTKYLFAIGLDNKEDTCGVRLKSGVQTGLTAQRVPFSPQIEQIPRGRVRVETRRIDSP